MLRIEQAAWSVMLDEAVRAYPEECCGGLFGLRAPEGGVVTQAVPLPNSSPDQRTTRYEIRPEDLLRADREARVQGMRLLGIYHSHPDRDAGFSETDLRHSCSWYVFVVLAIHRGRFHEARAWRPAAGETRAEPEGIELIETTGRSRSETHSQ